jgi:hypothetical protein
MPDYNLSQSEYLDYLMFKREKLLKEIKEVDSKIEEAKGLNAENIPAQQQRPWKFLIDDVLRASPVPLPASAIVSGILRSNHNFNKNTATKSVSSTLAQNSVEGRRRYLYAVRSEDGIKQYRLNESYKE